MNAPFRLPVAPSTLAFATARGTRQRAAIRRAFSVAARPLSPKEILMLAAREVPSLGIATVYRNLRAMVESGDLIAVPVPGQPDRYHPPIDPLPPLLRCSRCEKIIFLPLPERPPQLAVPVGFRIERVETFAHGQCEGACLMD